MKKLMQFTTHDGGVLLVNEIQTACKSGDFVTINGYHVENTLEEVMAIIAESSENKLEIAKFQHEISELKNSLRKTFKNYDANFNNSIAEISEFKNQIETLQAQNMDLKNEISKLNNAQISTGADVVLLKIENENHWHEIKNNNNFILQESEIITELQNEILNASNKINSLQREKRNFNIEFLKLQNEIENFKNVFGNIDTEFTEITKRLCNHDRLFCEIETRLKNFEA